MRLRNPASAGFPLWLPIELQAWGPRRSTRVPRSGLLVCSVNRSRYSISGINRSQRYICASHTNGEICARSNGLHVARQVAEERILAPTVKALLSPEAVARATREIHRIYGSQEGAATAPKRDARLARVDQQLEELSRLELEGVLDPRNRIRCHREGPQRARRTPRRNSARKARPQCDQDSGDSRRGVSQDGASDRRCLAAPGEDRAGAGGSAPIIGDKIPLRPAPSGDHLIAELEFSPATLLRAAGAETWNGSGGALREFPQAPQTGQKRRLVPPLLGDISRLLSNWA